MEERVFIFWTEYKTEESASWLGSEMRSGRLRQGWGLEGLSLVDRSGSRLGFDTWRRRYLQLARKENWAKDEVTEAKIRTRYDILLRMFDIRRGDLIVIPRKPNFDEVAFALATDDCYRFSIARGKRDFGHIVGIATESLRVAAYHSPVIGRLVSGFSNYRSAITPVRNYQFAQLISDAYARLASPRGPQANPDPAARYSDADNTLPDRILTAIERIVRDTAKGRELKAHYGHECQVCRTSIRLPAPNVPYVEVHHLVPLGQPSCGNDDWNNMIVVCPNCHAAFDYGSYRIHPETLRVHAPDRERAIKFIEGHRLSRRNLKCHWQLSEPGA